MIVFRFEFFSLKLFKNIFNDLWKCVLLRKKFKFILKFKCELVYYMKKEIL